MKIKSIEMFNQEPMSIVRVHTDNGSERWGKIFTYNADISSIVIQKNKVE